MKLNARWTAVSFVAATALGAATVAVTACTVTSGTVNDTDGGITNTPPPTTPPPVTPGTDAGDSGAAAACEGNKQTLTPIISTECQTCLETNCCAELKGCFNLDTGKADDGGAPNATCDDYTRCVSDCYDGDAGGDTCVTEICDAEMAKNSGTAGIPSAFNAFTTCGADKGCKTACNL